MGFFLPVNAQISNEQFSIEISQSVNTGVFALKLISQVFDALSFESLYDNFKIEVFKNNYDYYLIYFLINSQDFAIQLRKVPYIRLWQILTT